MDKVPDIEAAHSPLCPMGKHFHKALCYATGDTNSWGDIRSMAPSPVKIK